MHIHKAFIKQTYCDRLSRRRCSLHQWSSAGIPRPPQPEPVQYHVHRHHHHQPPLRLWPIPGHHPSSPSTGWPDFRYVPDRSYSPRAPPRGRWWSASWCELLPSCSVPWLSQSSSPETRDAAWCCWGCDRSSLRYRRGRPLVLMSCSVLCSVGGPSCWQHRRLFPSGLPPHRCLSHRCLRLCREICRWRLVARFPMTIWTVCSGYRLAEKKN